MVFTCGLYVVDFGNVLSFLLRVFVLWDLFACVVMLSMYFDCYELLLFLGCFGILSPVLLGCFRFWVWVIWVSLLVLGLYCALLYACVVLVSICL